MKIALASDHGGFELKNEIKKYLEERMNSGDPIDGTGEKIEEIIDIGTDSEESVE